MTWAWFSGEPRPGDREVRAKINLHVPDKLEPSVYAMSGTWAYNSPEPPEQIKAVDAAWLYELGIAWDERWGLEKPDGNDKAEEANNSAD